MGKAGWAGVVILGVLLSSSSWAVNGDMGVSTEPLTNGSEAYPWLIEDLADFDAFADPNNAATYWASGVHAKLMTDIDLSGRIYTRAVIAPDTVISGTFDGTRFTGTFNGNGNVIRNLVVNGAYYCGLFGKTDGNAIVADLDLEQVLITGSNEYVGGLVGVNDGYSIINCHVTGNVTGSRRYVGGLAGANWYGSISDSYSTASVNGSTFSDDVGGLVGHNYYGSVSSCHAAGAIKSLNRWIGGLVGLNEHGTVSVCYATGKVEGNDYVGGLVGGNNGSCNIIASYATGVVNGRYSGIGGLVGANLGSSITTSHAAGAVNGGSSSYSSSVGGLVGSNNSSSTINESFAAGAVTANCNYVGGLSGGNSGSITNSYATGQVHSSRSFVGGLTGDNSGKVANCYVTGQVDGDEYVGGIAGRNNNGTITFCYAASATNGNKYVGGLVGRHHSGNINSSYFYTYGGPDNHYGTPLDDSQLVNKASFVDFDFAENTLDGTGEIWNIETGYMPRLSWQAPPGIEAPYRLDKITTSLSGTGYPNDPFVIADFDDLMEFRANSQLRVGFYSLSSDIDLTGSTAYSDAFIRENFQGAFAGNGHVVSNLTINGGGNLGFFSFLSGSVSGLGLENASVTGFGYVATLVGYSEGHIINSYAIGTVHGYWNLGGLVGYNFYGSITHSYAAVNVTTSGGVDSGGVGGLVGVCVGSISSCYASGAANGYYGGGLAGLNSGNISDSYATGAVNGYYSGGLVGLNSGTISGSYAAGEVNGYYIGGLAGLNEATITFSFWDKEVSGLEVSSGGTGLTTAEMQTLSTFAGAGWDFMNEDVNGTSDFWRMCTDGVDYPRLSWESGAGDFACPDGVGLEDLEHYAGWWLAVPCHAINNCCAGSDMDYSGSVDLEDFAVFAMEWMGE